MLYSYTLVYSVLHSIIFSVAGQKYNPIYPSSYHSHRKLTLYNGDTVRLNRTPTRYCNNSGIQIVLLGSCHLLNFRIYLRHTISSYPIIFALINRTKIFWLGNIMNLLLPSVADLSGEAILVYACTFFHQLTL